MLGLFPEHVEMHTRGRRRLVPEAVMEELQRLKGLYEGFHYRELCRIIYYKTGDRLDHKTIKRLWQQLPLPSPPPLPRLDYHSHSARPQARAQVITLYCQGWSKISISRFLHVSRPTVRVWIRRFEREDLTGLEDKSRAPKAPARKAWLPLMIAVYHLQKRHPDAGRFRMWSLLGQDEVSVRTIGRVMALNKRVYDDIPHVHRQRAKQDPQPHPYKAQSPHEVWFIDGRQMDFTLHGIKWWSIVILEGYSRTMLAAAVALLCRRASLAEFTPDMVAAPHVRELMQRVSHARDPELEQHFPRQWPAWAAIELHDGRKVFTTVRYPKGDPQNPLSWDELLAKYRELGRSVLPADRLHEIHQRLRYVESAPAVAPLWRMLRPTVIPDA